MNSPLLRYCFGTRKLFQSSQSLPVKFQPTSRWWILGLLLTGLSTISWGQCFNTSTVPLNPTTNPVASPPKAEAVGDFNGDGKPDLAVAGAVAPSVVSILLNTGSGSFGPAINYPISFAFLPSDIAVGDFNGDGKPDLSVAGDGVNRVAILLNTGDGTFGAATTYPVGTSPQSIAVGDFNADGKPDLATANQSSSNVSVLLNLGGGTFSAATSLTVGSGASAIVSGDFNSDGKPDLITANLGGSISFLPGTGTGGFGLAVSSLLPNMSFVPRLAKVGDFNGDTKLDLALTDHSTNIQILLGNGAGGFGFAPATGPTGGRGGLTIGDFNGDGKDDLASTAYTANTVFVQLGNGDGTFQSASSITVGAMPTAILSADFNGDGKLDLSVINSGANNVSVLSGNGDGSFGTVATAPRSVAVADFNADGKPDLAVSNAGSNTVSVLLANSSGGFGTETTFPVGNSPHSVAVGDFNGDGRPDLVTANTNSNNVSVLLGNGDGGFGMAPTVAVGTNPYSIVVGDFNADGKQDLVTANDGSSNISVLLGNGSGGFGSPTNFPVGSGPRAVAAGDVNGDGKPDLITANFFSSNVSVLLGNGSGGFGIAANSGVGTNPGFVVIGDVNGDGKADLAVANYSANNVSILLGNGSSVFGAPTNYAVVMEPTAIVLRDVNGDGKSDLAVTNFGSNNVSVLLGNGGGGFGTKTNFTVGLLPNSIAVGDFNGDGKPDLVTANLNSNNVSLLLNCTTAGNTAPTLANTIPNQTGTVGQAFTYTIPANTFTDAETPGSLVLSASGLPAGLSLMGATISGTPSASGVSTVTIKATDPGSLFVNATFTITINPAGSPPPAGPFSITSVTTLGCTPAGNRINVAFNPQYAGVNGQPITFRVVNETVPSTNPGPYSVGLYSDNPVITLEAIQSGVTTTFAYNWLNACSGPTPGNTAPTVTNPIPNQTGTAGQAFTYTVPANTFTDAQTPGSLVLSASGLPAGLSLAGSVISGTPSMSGVSTVTITATDPGSLAVSTTFTITINPAVGPPPPPSGTFSITSVTTISCTPAGNRINVAFTPQYAGINGQPITFRVVNETLPTTNPGPYSVGLYTDNPVINLEAIQSGTTTTFAYNWRAACGVGTRIAAEPTANFQVRLLGNPVRNAVDFEVTGAEGTALKLSLTDMQGRSVNQTQIEQAGLTERHRFDVSTQPAGLLLLRASTPTQSKTVRVFIVN